MAYGEKYHVIYCDRNGKQFRLGIHEWDYVGPSVKHKAAPVPFSITQETSSELKLGGIYPTRAIITLVSSKTFNMEELYTADERKYLVTHEPTDGSDQGKWYGNIIPNGFHEEMDNDVHYMVLTASDNLPTLKLKLFTQDDGTNYGLPDGDFEKSFMWVAKEALKKTGFLLPIWTMVDVKPMTSGNGQMIAVKISVHGTDSLTIFEANGLNPSLLIPDARISISGSSNGNNGVYTINSVTPIPGVGYALTVSGGSLDYSGSQYEENVEISVLPETDASTLPDPLAITLHDIRTYIIDKDIEGQNYYEVHGAAMTTWDVLNNLAKQFNAKIMQNNGRWEITRWNALGVDAGEYEYFVYNSEGVEIGREPFGDDITYPCKNTRTEFRPFGHSIGMDRVLGAVGVNYRYRYKQEGDSLVNLIKNGNFSPTPVLQVPPPTSNPATYTPYMWLRKTISGLPFNLQYFSMPGSGYPPGHESFLRVSGEFMYTTYLTSETGYSAPVSAGDSLKIMVWVRSDYMTHLNLNQLCPLVVRIMVRENPANRVTLVNDGKSGLGILELATSEQLANPVEIGSMWVNPVEMNDDALSFLIGGESILQTPISAKSPWRQYIIRTPPSPVSGQLVVEIVGVANPFPTSVINEYYGPQTSAYDASGVYRRRNTPNAIHFTPNHSADITGLFVAKIVDPSSEAVPTIHPYWYANDGAYTDRIDDIEVMFGDDGSPDHVSNIYVMDGSTKKSIKSWDSWANDFGWGALGLVLAKSVMQQYYRPWRIIDGDFVASSIHWASRLHFEERPGERYALLRGTIDYRNNRFSGTIVQVADDGTTPLPPGGNDGGTTVDPNWQPTGTVRCIRDSDGLNTGEQERLETDTNPSSQTYGQFRWVNIGENTDQCPIGDPIDIYWGASAVFPVDPGALNYFPYEKDGDDYTVAFDNDGTGKHLVFLHRASLGTVQSIVYPGTPWNAYGDLPSWEYLSDMTINGYTYKVMRQIYPSGTFTGMGLTFNIQ